MGVYVGRCLMGFPVSVHVCGCALWDGRDRVTDGYACVCVSVLGGCLCALSVCLCAWWHAHVYKMSVNILGQCWYWHGYVGFI